MGFFFALSEKKTKDAYIFFLVSEWEIVFEPLVNKKKKGHNVKMPTECYEEYAQSVVLILSLVCIQNQDFTEYPDTLEVLTFVNQEIPTISPSEYVKRFTTYIDPGYDVLLMTVILMDRLCLITKICINFRTFHRLFLSCFTVSHKYIEDEFYKNSYYAKVGGVSLLELNVLEKRLLSFLKYNVHCSKDQLECYSSIRSIF